jgi:hypothetical protein
VRWLFGAVAVLALASSLSGQLVAPTAEDVEAAVDDYFTDDAAAKTKSHESLREWGDAALPHLRTLAGEPSRLPRVMPFSALSLINDLPIVCAIDAIGSEAAMELLIEIAQAKTGVDPARGLDQLESGALYKYEKWLKDNARFKALVIRSTLERSGPLAQFQRASAARTIAQLGWTDATEIVEAMVHDESPLVAESAAGAVFALTGRRVEVPRPALGFPGRLEGAPPLSAPRDAPTSRSLRFGFWRDGRAGLLVSKDRELQLVGPDGQPAATWEVPRVIASLLSYRTPSGEGRWVEATAGDDYAIRVERVVASDWEGLPLWELEPEEQGQVSMAVLYDEAGPCGIALSPTRRRGLVALDDTGAELFTTWITPNASLGTHPELPGRLLAFGHELVILDSEGRPTTPGRMQFTPKSRGAALFSDEVQLFPDAEGRPAIIASGRRMSMAPVIARLDHELVEVWSATVPGTIGGLAMLEPEGRPRLFAAACTTGELYVFDENGASYEPIRLVDDLDPGDSMWVHAMQAGRFDDGRWGLAIALSGRTLLFILQ